MWSRKQPPRDDATQADDPLQAFKNTSNPHTASTQQRLRPGASPDKVATQMLDPNTASNAEQGDFSSRRFDRLKRQATVPRIYPSSVRTAAQRFQNLDNRQLMVIGGILLVLLIGILLIRLATRNNTETGLEGTPENGLATQPSAQSQPDNAPVGIGVLPTPQGAAPTFAPVAATGGSFVVINTGIEGLRIRSDGSLSAAQIGTFPDGTRVEALNEEKAADGYTWIKVRGPQGEGWVAKEFLQTAP